MPNMKSLRLIKGLALLAGLATSSPLASRDESLGLLKRQSCNTASNRQCWSPGFDINTDYEASVPDTGVTVKVSCFCSHFFSNRRILFTSGGTA